jgi:hypothetical protein
LPATAITPSSTATASLFWVPFDWQDTNAAAKAAIIITFFIALMV